MSPFPDRRLAPEDVPVEAGPLSIATLRLLRALLEKVSVQVGDPAFEESAAVLGRAKRELDAELERLAPSP